MRLFKNSTIILVACLCVLVSDRLTAKILWDKDLTLDVNVNSAPLASCLNKDGNGIIVMTVECSKGSFPTKGNNVLWEIGTDGNAIRFSPKNTDGSKVWTDANPVWPGCAVASDSLGNLLTVGILSGQKDERKVAIISKVDKTEKIMSPRNSIESRSVKKLIPLQDNTYVLTGDRDGNGLCLRIDSQGKVIQEKTFDRGQTEIFSDIDQIRPDNSNLVVSGISVKTSTKDHNESSAENFLLIYDSNLKKVHECYFAEGMPGLLFPRVCCLDNGNIIVLYKKKSEDSKTLLWTRCYTKELKLLWEKEIFAADEMPFFFDMVSCKSGGFVVWIGQIECLDFYFLDNDGTKIDSVQYKSTSGGAFGVAGFNLIRANGMTIAVFKEGTAGNIKECTIKAKVIAWD